MVFVLGFFLGGDFSTDRGWGVDKIRVGMFCVWGGSFQRYGGGDVEKKRGTFQGHSCYGISIDSAAMS